MAGKTFNPAGMDSAHLGKMTVRRTAKKAKSKRKKALKEKRVNVSYPKWKVSKWLLGKQD